VIVGFVGWGERIVWLKKGSSSREGHGY